MAKIRVYELASELGVSSKSVLRVLKEMGEFVRSASSTLEAPVVKRLRELSRDNPSRFVDGPVDPPRVLPRTSPNGSPFLTKEATRPKWTWADGEYMSFFGQRLTKLPELSPDQSSTRVLDLNGNNLQCLPESIGSLENLEIIFAGGNRLEELPAGIGNLTKLRVLDLDRNLLHSLPAHLNPSGSLQLLRLDNNRISTLPSSLAPHLRNGLTLTLDGNPLDEPIPMVANDGADSLATYLETMSEPPTELFEARVLFLGEGNVGKSSLVAALGHQPFIENRSTTHGIEISSLSVSHPTLDKEIRLSFWDFGGQEVYRVTHRVLLQPSIAVRGCVECQGGSRGRRRRGVAQADPGSSWTGSPNHSGCNIR